MKPPQVVKIACLLIALALPVTGQAQFTFTTNDDNTITITDYTGSNGVVTIPGSIGGLPVVSIGDWAFYAASVTNVLIADSVTSIGDGAFFDCESLTNVTIGSSVTNIGDWTFAFCPSLTSVCCRGNAPSLGGGNVFYGNLATMYYLSGATNWGPLFDGHPAVLWNPNVPFTYTINSDGITLTITGYAGSDGTVIIPSNINFLPVTSIGDFAFIDCFILTSVTIPNGVTSIGEDAFYNCYFLASVTIPNGVTNIEDGAFIDCWPLTDVTIPDSVISIGDYAFWNCFGLTNITIGTNVTSIGITAFYNCYKMTSITIPNSVTNIKNGAFGNWESLTNVTIPNNVTSIGYGAFYNCTSLTSVYFQGNAPTPTNDLSVFANDNNVTAYYLPGTTGWGASFDGLPTALGFLPYPVIINSPSFGVQTNCFGFTIAWATNISVVVEACTNLTNPVWQPVQTNMLTTDSAYFSDPQWTNYPSRFYRLRSP